MYTCCTPSGRSGIGFVLCIALNHVQKLVKQSFAQPTRLSKHLGREDQSTANQVQVEDECGDSKSAVKRKQEPHSVIIWRAWKMSGSRGHVSQRCELSSAPPLTGA